MEADASKDATAAEDERGRLGGRASQPAASAWPDPSQGGCLSNTHPQTSQVKVDGYPALSFAGGIDWLEWSAVVEWNPICFVEMVLDFQAIKQELQEARQASKWIEFKDSLPIQVCRTGANRGGDRGQHFDFKIVHQGVTIGIANRPEASPTLPSIFARLTGSDCLRLGGRKAYEDVRQFVAFLGGTVTKEALSRIDLCLDVAGLEVEMLQNLVDRRQVVTKSRKVVPRRNAIDDVPSGFDAGTRPVRLSVYDKLLEQSHKADQLYLQALIDRRWGGVVPSAATRIEFQLSREWLLEHGVSSPADAFEKQGSLVAYLTQEWFRIVDDRVDRENNNQSRADVHPLWSAIAQAFSLVYGNKPCELVPIRRERIKPVRLAKQAAGCLANALLQMGVGFNGFPDFLYRSAELIGNAIKSPAERAEFMQTLEHRRTEFLA